MSINKLTKTFTQHIHNQSDDDDLSDEINDKLSQLWTGMRNKRKQMIRNLTPGHSRRSQRTLSSINNGNNTTNNTTTNILTNTQLMNNSKDYTNNKKQSHNNTNQMIKIKQKLLQQHQQHSLLTNDQQNNIKNIKNNNQQQSSQIRRLKQTIDKLTADNNQLLGHLNNCLRNNNEGLSQQRDQYQYSNDYGELNDCTEIQVRQNYSIENQQNSNICRKQYFSKNQYLQTNVDGRTANFYQQNHNINKNNNKNNNINNNQNNNKKSSLSILPQQQNQKKTNILHQQNNKKKLNNLTGKRQQRKSKSNKQNVRQSSMTRKNCSNKQNTHPNSSINSHSHYQSQTQQSFPHQQTIQSLSTHRLIQLLKSTSQYRQFAYYYDSHQLSYLKRLQQQHKKNCHVNLSQQEKRYWAPTQLIQKMLQSNKRNDWGLNQHQVQQIIGQMKVYFERNEQLRLKQQKDDYMKKIQKLKRQKQNNIPYDLVRLSNAKQREQSMKKHHNNVINKSLR